MFKETVHKADLQNGYYLNPILDGDYPDPAVMRENGDFYLCVSTADYFPGLTIFHSTDLVNWHTLCHPLAAFHAPVWAPDILKYGDTYYIYFCGGGSNWFIHSQHIDRDWSDPIDLGIGKHLDPAHCADDAGNRYLFVSKNNIVPLSPDGLSVCGEMKQILTAPKIPDAWDVEGAFPEAPNIFRKDGYYYLTFADGGTTGPATSHMVMAARAKHPEGPWELSPYNPIIHTFYREETWISKGHGHFVDDADGNWWVIYHAYENGRHAAGRKLLLSPVEFTPDGWFTVTTPADEAAKKPAGTPVGIMDVLSDDFKTEGPMPPQWRAKGILDPDRIRRTANGLVFQGMDSAPGASNPLTVITGDKSFEIEAEVSLDGPCAAGLIYLYDRNIYNSLSLTGTELIIHRTGKVLTRIPYTSSRCTMKMRVKQGYLSFWYKDGGKFRKLNYVIDTSAQNTLAYGGFLSLRPGIFSVGEGTARFSYFHYTGLQ